MEILSDEYFHAGEKIAITHSVWNNSLKKHKHSFFEIAFITKGSGFHVLNNTKSRIQKGALFLITPQSTHNLIGENEPFEWINILFFPSAISTSLIDSVGTDEIFKALISTQAIHYSTKGLTDIELQNDNRGLQYIFEEMLSEYKERKTGYQNVLKGYLEILLVKIFRAYFLPEGTDTEILQVVLDYLKEKTFSQNLSINDLAKRAFFSPQYFRKLFKKETGIPLSTFIRQKRIELAKQLLESTDLTVREAMEKVGFNDSKAFYLAFKKAYGILPGEVKAFKKL